MNLNESLYIKISKYIYIYWYIADVITSVTVFFAPEKGPSLVGRGA